MSIWGQIGVLKNSNNLDFRPSAAIPTYEAHRAVNYYYHGFHNIPVAPQEGGLKIEVASREESGVGGKYSHQTGSIIIFNSPSIRPYHIHFLSIVLHEIGHFTHHRMNSNFAGSWNIQKQILSESWASYVGRELCEEYYETLGFPRLLQNSPTRSHGYTSLLGIGINFDITWNARQHWRYTLSPELEGYYTPLFVDLRDKYNQAVMNVHVP